jgi:hypothetical protein
LLEKLCGIVCSSEINTFSSVQNITVPTEAIDSVTESNGTFVVNGVPSKPVQFNLCFGPFCLNNLIKGLHNIGKHLHNIGKHFREAGHRFIKGVFGGFRRFGQGRRFGGYGRRYGGVQRNGYGGYHGRRVGGDVHHDRRDHPELKHRVNRNPNRRTKYFYKHAGFNKCIRKFTRTSLQFKRCVRKHVCGRTYRKYGNGHRRCLRAHRVCGNRFKLGSRRFRRCINRRHRRYQHSY